MARQKSRVIRSDSRPTPRIGLRIVFFMALRIKTTFFFAAFLLLHLSCGMGIKSGGGEVPSVTGATSTANADGTVSVTITGTGFVVGVTVTVAGYACTPVTVVSSTQLTCILPRRDIPLSGIVVTSPSGGSSGSTTFHTIFVATMAIDAAYSNMDGNCTSAAAAGSKTSTLTGTWRAIVSKSSKNAKDRITFISGSSIQNTAGQTIVTSSASLWGGALLNSPAYDADGGTPHSGPAIPHQVWTGSTSAGVYNSGGGSSTNTCADWTDISAANSGTTGLIGATDGKWLDNGTTNCGFPGTFQTNGSIYCINSQN